MVAWKMTLNLVHEPPSLGGRFTLPQGSPEDVVARLSHYFSQHRERQCTARDYLQSDHRDLDMRPSRAWMASLHIDISAKLPDRVDQPYSAPTHLIIGHSIVTTPNNFHPYSSRVTSALRDTRNNAKRILGQRLIRTNLIPVSLQHIPLGW